MSVFDVIIIFGGICGLCMVIGGILLLYKGAISLQGTSEQEAVNVEFKKMLKIRTYVPALGLFVIGLAFIISSASLSYPERRGFRIEGEVQIDDPQSLELLAIEIKPAESWRVPVYEGRIIASIIPKFDLLEMTLEIPGYKIKRVPIETQRFNFGKLDIGSIIMGRKVSNKPTRKYIEGSEVELAPVSDAEEGVF